MKSLLAAVVVTYCVLPLPVNAQTSNAAALRRASFLVGQGKFADAETILQKFVDQNPRAYRAWYLLGVAQHRQQKLQPAMASYQRAKQGPGVRDVAWYNLAAAQAQAGEFDGAMQSLTTACKAGFNNVDRLEHDARFGELRKSQQFAKLLSDQRHTEQIFAEDTRIIHRWLGEAAGDEFGWIARLVGDVDSDTVLDFVTTAPSHGGGNGKIYVYSGQSRELLFDVTGVNNERLGNGAASAGDVNGDQVPDVVVGAPSHPAGGAVYVYSGVDGQQLLAVKSQQRGAQLGYKVCSLGDVDGDGRSDMFATAIAADGEQPKSGAGFAYSGKTGELLFQLKGERGGDKFGSAACATRKGKQPLLAVGAQDAGKNQRGRVYVYRLDTEQPELAFQIEGDANSVNLGMMFVSFPGDVNQDGVLDVYASDFGDNTGAAGAGKVVLHDGANGQRLFAITGRQPGEGLGTSPSEAGDVNGDGIGDLIIGAWQNRSGAPSGGRVSLHDGRTGKELDAWTCVQRGDTFGFDAVGMGDVDGDGHIDFLLTSAWANIHGPQTGRIYVIAGKDNFGENRDVPTDK